MGLPEGASGGSLQWITGSLTSCGGLGCPQETSIKMLTVDLSLKPKLAQPGLGSP